jgi:hypothetical protein
MSPLYKTPLEQLLQGSQTNQQVAEKLKATHNNAIDACIEVVKGMFELRISDGDEALETVIFKLKELIK